MSVDSWMVWRISAKPPGWGVHVDITEEKNALRNEGNQSARWRGRHWKKEKRLALPLFVTGDNVTCCDINQTPPSFLCFVSIIWWHSASLFRLFVDRIVPVQIAVQPRKCRGGPAGQWHHDSTGIACNWLIIWFICFAPIWPSSPRSMVVSSYLFRCLLHQRSTCELEEHIPSLQGLASSARKSIKEA